MINVLDAATVGWLFGPAHEAAFGLLVSGGGAGGAWPIEISHEEDIRFVILVRPVWSTFGHTTVRTLEKADDLAVSIRVKEIERVSEALRFSVLLDDPRFGIKVESNEA